MGYREKVAPVMEEEEEMRLIEMGQVNKREVRLGVYFT